MNKPESYKNLKAFQESLNEVRVKSLVWNEYNVFTAWVVSLDGTVYYWGKVEIEGLLSGFDIEMSPSIKSQTLKSL